jgi:hypothetical protein
MISNSRKVGGAILVLAGSIAAGIPTVAAEPTKDSSTSAPAISQTVKGDVLNIEGEFYFVKDLTGHELRLHVNKETKTDGKVKVGDKIEARVTPEGQVTSLTLQIPPSGTVPLVPSRPGTAPTVP